MTSSFRLPIVRIAARHPMRRPFSSARAARFVAVAALAGLSALAGAQSLYRSVGPDGRVTYTDQPPPPAPRGREPGAARPDGTTNRPVEPAGRPAATGGGDIAAGLPYELRQTVGRFPVTLYTGPDCNGCAVARTYLRGRGVPFAEKIIATNDDIDALQRAVGQNALPSATIGQQQLRGFSQAEWAAYLNAAGYPESSQLPASYRYPSAAPLTVPKPVAAAPAPAAPARAEAPPPAAPPSSGPGTANPAGIKF